METANVPWTTAPMVVRGMLPDLDLSSETWVEARRLAREYDGAFGMAPSSIAVGAVYWSALVNHEKVTQQELTEACGTAPATITKAYRAIAKAEGHDVAPRQKQSQESSGRDSGWSLTIPTSVFTGVKSLAVPVAVAVIGSVWVVGMMPAEQFAQAAADIEAQPVFTGPMFMAVVLVTGLAALITALRPLVGVVR